MPNPAPERLRVVIVGAGFAGLTAARALARAPFDVTLVDRHNYHLFQPLLYQVATAGLSPADIAAPIRGILRTQANARVVLAEVTGVYLARNEVIAEDRRIPFDRLILATGARHAYFGHAEWAVAAPGLKTIDDATYLRRRILLAFEKAETEPDAAERRRLLTFVVVGGGPTGVEMAGAIAELARRTLARDFRAIDPRTTRIVLVEAGPRLLPAFDPRLSDAARASLDQLGVEVRLGAPVTALDCGGVALGSERLEARTLVWGAGVMASPAGEWLNAATDRAGRVAVAPDLSLPGRPDVFVIGDTAHVPDVPGIAPAAKQQAEYVARLLIAQAAGRTLPPFRYRDLGALATIGRKRAVAEFGRLRVRGFAAWLLWSVAHIWFLIGFRNRAVVALTWAWSYLTFQRGTRLITGQTGARIPAISPAVQDAARTIADRRMKR
jgi:NADH:quinone reductase (non-electrogenic)